MPRTKNKEKQLIINYSTLCGVVLCLGVLVFTFTISYLVSAWTEPTVSPPGGNVDTPLNVGTVGQYKLGGLIINVGDTPTSTGLMVATGSVAIGNLSGFDSHGNAILRDPKYTLDVNGTIYAATDVCIPGTCLSNIGGGGGLWASSSPNIYNTNSGSVNIASSTNIGGNLNLQNQILTLNGAAGTNNQVLISSANGMLYWVNINDVINSQTNINISNPTSYFSGMQDCPSGYERLQKYWSSATIPNSHYCYGCTVNAAWSDYNSPPCCSYGVWSGLNCNSASFCASAWTKVLCAKISDPTALVYGAHNQSQCSSVGNVADDGSGNKFCRINGATCPSAPSPPWRQYQSWSTTNINTCYGACYAGFCSPSCGHCTTASHASWGNVPQETCSYSDWCASEGQCCLTSTCGATITQIGCY